MAKKSTRKKYRTIDWKNPKDVREWFNTRLPPSFQPRMYRIHEMLKSGRGEGEILKRLHTEFHIKDDAWGKWYINRTKILEKLGMTGLLKKEFARKTAAKPKKSPAKKSPKPAKKSPSPVRDYRSEPAPVPEPYL